MLDTATPEQRLLLDSSTDFIDRHCPLAAVRDRRYRAPGPTAEYRRRARPARSTSATRYCRP